MIVSELVAHFGWEELSRQIPIRCFTHEPSVSSSLKFLRRTPWAKKKVEDLYLVMRGAAGREGHGGGGQPLGFVRRDPLLKEGVPGGPVRKALHHGGSAADGTEGAVAHGEVVVDEVEFGLLPSLEDHLLRAGETNLSVRHEDLHRLAIG